MSRVEAAAGMDRLPWLPDEPAPKPAKRRGSLLGWAAGALLLVAGGGSWLGTRSVDEISRPAAHHAQPNATVRLPIARPVPQPEVRIAPQPQVRLAAPPEVRPAPAREVRIAPPKPVAREAGKPVPSDEQAPAQEPTAESTTVSEPAPVAAPSPPVVGLKPWQPRVVRGAAGRLVEIGAFGSVSQAKLGWRYMVRAYPAMTHLPAVVRPDRNSRGRLFYRFRVGTTSQAHSEVLCQRMAKIHLSCAVVGLPWKAKVER
jgi:hypothetical protein